MLSGVVYVVDDDGSVREALSSLIRSVGLEVDVYGTAGEFLARERTAEPACLVLDVRLPGVDGLALQRELAGSERVIPIVFITGHGDIRMSVRAMKAGAVEFLPKPLHDEELLGAIAQALDHDRHSVALHRERGDIAKRHASLTPRERQVLEPIVRGLLNKQVASELGISEITVKVHRRHIMSKMRAASFADLVRMVERLPRDNATYTNGQ